MFTDIPPAIVAIKSLLSNPVLLESYSSLDSPAIDDVAMLYMIAFFLFFVVL